MHETHAVFEKRCHKGLLRGVHIRMGTKASVAILRNCKEDGLSCAGCHDNVPPNGAYLISDAHNLGVDVSTIDLFLYVLCGECRKHVQGGVAKAQAAARDREDSES